MRMVVAEDRIASELLELTAAHVDLWRAAINCGRQFYSKYIDDLERLIGLEAKTEWGPDTKVSIDRERQEVIVVSGDRTKSFRNKSLESQWQRGAEDERRQG